MTQANPVLGANLSGLTYRTQDNNAKRALMNHHKGPTAPTYAEAGMFWIDDNETPWQIKIHDSSDWITLGTINAANQSFSPYHGTAPLRILSYAEDVGSENAYAVNPVPAIDAYANGQIVTLKPAQTNTGPSTLNINGLGAESIKSENGDELQAGTLLASGFYLLAYNGTHFIPLNSSVLNDTAFVIQNGGDPSKKVKFDASNVTASETRTLSIPDANGFLALLEQPQTWTGQQRFKSLSVPYQATLSISSGVLLPTGTRHIIDTEDATAIDDVDIILAGINGDIFIARSASSERTVTFKNGTGNIRCGKDRTLNNTNSEIGFIYDAETESWHLLFFSDQNLSEQSGRIVNRNMASTSTPITTSATIPPDNTQPLPTEGEQILSLSHTPQSAGNILKITASIAYGGSSANSQGAITLFRDTTLMETASTAGYRNNTSMAVKINMTQFYTVPSTDAVNFSVRAGAGSGSMNINTHVVGGNLYGGSMNSTLIVEEYAP